jgi:ribosome maturation factor RimP
MNGTTQIEIIENKVRALISGEPDLFLVETRIKPTNNIKVFVDGDQGISIERLVQLNRKLYKDLEESAMFPGGDFSLELSSPGLDEPLKLHRQYLKNVGRYVEITDVEGVQKSGKMISVTETEIVLEEEKARLTGKVGQGKNKKKEILEHRIPFETIKTTKIQIKF